MGERDSPGIVPQFSKELFERTVETSSADVSFMVQVSYYEIYNEKIYDLLASSKLKNKTRLRVREHPVMGPYVEDLSMYVANTYTDIEHWLNLGNRFRATAATGMNDRSSRSHSVFTILLTQTEVVETEEHSKVSRINLIDLAGSEKSSVSQTSGDRLREGASINRSLHSLGKVISLLSEKSTGRRKVYIPYRDSTLTWLLKESLGGNSKTAMIATISPANLHYEESLSTLRYAQQARTIVNVARINEDPNVKLIRELRQEIEYLRSLTALGLDASSSSTASTVAEVRGLREKLKESEKLMNSATQSWEEKLQRTEARKMEEIEKLKVAGMLKVDNRLPNLVNLNEDPQLSEMLLYVLKEGTTTVGSHTSFHDIQLTGALVAERHCSIVNMEGSGKVFLEPSEDLDAQTYINGNLVSSSTELHHGDRVIIGGEHFFRFNHPSEVEQGLTSKASRTFEFARNELIQAQTARLEAELEEKRLRDKEEMMVELQVVKEEAQKEMDQQRMEYELTLKKLEDQMQEQKSEQEAFSQLQELQRRNKMLEEETVAQKHIIHLEKMKTEKEYEEMKEHKSRLMAELEQEKAKLQGDIAKLTKNKDLRKEQQNSSSLHTSPSSSSSVSTMRGSELLRVSMMLQEANAICKTLNKPLAFTREDSYEGGGEVECRVRVNNTQLGMVTHWDWTKFESRLEQMKDAYQLASSSSGVSLMETESVLSGVSENEDDPFVDPSDEWEKDSLLLTPLNSPHRTALCRSLLSNGGSASSLGINTPLSYSSGLLNRSFSIPKTSTFITEIYGSKKATNYTQAQGSEVKGTVSHGNDNLSQFSDHESLMRLCRDRLSSVLTFNEESLSSGPYSLYQRVLGHVASLQNSSVVLEESFEKHLPTSDMKVSFSETADVRRHTLALHTSLHLLLESSHALREQLMCVQIPFHPGIGTDEYEDENGDEDGDRVHCNQMEPVSKQLIGTVCHQTALYCSKLLQGLDDGLEEEVIRESRQNLHESLDAVVSLVGQLALAHRVQERRAREQHSWKESMMEGESGWRGRGSDATASIEGFFSVQPYQKLAASFYRGHCIWCEQVVSASVETIRRYLLHINETTPPSELSTHSLELFNSVCRVVNSLLQFLQVLSDMQTTMWCIEELLQEEDSGTIPLTPNINHVVDMLLNLQQAQEMVRDLHEEGLLVATGRENLENLSVCNTHNSLSASELAASVLTVIKSSPASAANKQEMSSKVQSLSQQTARNITKLTKVVKKRSHRHAQLAVDSSGDII